jgi:hypothetical protein
MDMIPLPHINNLNNRMSTSRSTTIATEAVEETKGAAFIVYGISNAELPVFLRWPSWTSNAISFRPAMQAIHAGLRRLAGLHREEFGSNQIRAEENPSNLR